MSEIKENEYYTLKETSEILKISVPILSKKCREGTIECSNIGSEKRANYRIQGKNILNLLIK